MIEDVDRDREAGMRRVWVATILGLAVAVAAGIALFALGVPGGESGPRGDTGVSGNVGVPSDRATGEPEAKLVKPRPGMVRMQRVAWQRAEERGDRVVRVFFESGVEPCYVLDHVDVEYLDQEIRITLFEGSDPEAGDAVCIQIAVLKAVDVTLAEPVRGRRLVDGSRLVGR
jgi:hypothetical protein